LPARERRHRLRCPLDISASCVEAAIAFIDARGSG
jgi:hypothetical protein